MFTSDFKQSVNQFLQSRIMLKQQQIVGLDIGSSKVVCLVAHKSQKPSVNGESTANLYEPNLDLSPFQVIGIGEEGHSGVSQGCVVDFVEVLRAIKKAKAEAEAISGEKISGVWVSLSGSHIDVKTCYGQITIDGPLINENDIDRVCRLSLRQLDLTERELVQSMPLSFSIDGQDTAGSPLGLAGQQLKVCLQTITGHRVRIQKIIKCVSSAGLKVNGLVPTAYAAALAVTQKQEQETGVVVIDMGAGCCQYVCIQDRKLKGLGFIPVGGQHFTHDVMVGLNTTQIKAEELKIKVGIADVWSSESQSVEPQNRQVSFEPVQIKKLYKILEARAKETLSLILNEIGFRRANNRFQSGVILTGGASQLKGLLELGLFVMDEKMKLGVPFGLKGIKPTSEWARYSAVLGLLYFGIEQDLNPHLQTDYIGSKGGITSRIQSMFDDFAEKSQKILTQEK